MSRYLRVSVFAVVLMAMQTAYGGYGDKGKREFKPARQQSTSGATLIDINNLASWVQPDALFPANVNQNFNGSFPRGANAGFVYQEGIVYGGLVKDGSTPAVRVGGTTYPTGMQAGRILTGPDGSVIGAQDPGDTGVDRVWRVRPDYKTADLTPDAAAYFQQDSTAVTQAQIDEVRAMYQSDWNEWPADEGAPYVDNICE